MNWKETPTGALCLPQPLTANAQALNQILVPFRIAASQVFQYTAPARNHQQQSTAGVMVLFMRFEMIPELQNAQAQEGYLYFWRPGIRLVSPVFCDYTLLNISRQCHAWIDTPRLTLISLCTKSGYHTCGRVCYRAHARLVRVT
jgi:hypothetical protein